jgi:hypothetical protein
MLQKLLSDDFCGCSYREESGTNSASAAQWGARYRTRQGTRGTVVLAARSTGCNFKVLQSGQTALATDQPSAALLSRQSNPPEQIVAFLGNVKEKDL